jgi:hypothetical protein
MMLAGGAACLRPASNNTHEIKWLSEYSGGLRGLRVIRNPQASKKLNEIKACGLAGLAALKGNANARKGRSPLDGDGETVSSRSRGKSGSDKLSEEPGALVGEVDRLRETYLTRHIQESGSR